MKKKETLEEYNLRQLFKNKAKLEELINKDYKQLVFDIDYKIFMLNRYSYWELLNTDSLIKKLENEKFELINSYKNLQDGYYQKELEGLDKEIERLKQLTLSVNQKNN